MAFVLKKERRVEWPVKVRVAEDGRSRVHQFKATFRIPDLDEAKGALGEGTDQDRVREFCRDHLESWSGVNDENGAALPCDDDTKTMLLSQVNALNAVAQAFLDAIEGGPAKN